MFFSSEGMELEQPILGNHAISMTFDEVYMERSMGFVKALQELKNLRPQLYSASEYCEKTYIQNEEKQMVVDNIKDYAVRALVNAVDHLGTVAYKLTELIEQQSMDVSNVELKVSCLSQQLLTCQTYMDKEGLRQQQLLGIIPRHHKHYILPSNAASKTLSWNLASEAKPTSKGTTAIHAETGRVNENENVPTKAAGVFHLVGESPTAAHRQQSSGTPSSRALGQSSAASPHKWTESGNAKRGERVRIPVRSKSVLSAFFVKQKTPMVRQRSVASISSITM